MKTLLNVKVDAKTKRAAQKIAEELGLSLSAVVNANLHQFVRDREISLNAPLKPSKWLKTVIKETEEDIKLGRNIVGPFDSAEAMIASLRKNAKAD
ncbi:MAG TPA: type II toxin-antitoxin system RelB/DinJ family antitoxin [Candidatus Saccharimonadales bacterium]|nr:type II toxin-antitoxin system RelB/DinJ family antitoxin [Candidatus Saccharimonadales bacterium]